MLTFALLLGILAFKYIYPDGYGLSQSSVYSLVLKERPVPLIWNFDPNLAFPE